MFGALPWGEGCASSAGLGCSLATGSAAGAVEIGVVSTAVLAGADVDTEG
jgi:hypothetical protein